MEKLLDDGLVKSIGVSNFSVKKLRVRTYVFPVCLATTDNCRRKASVFMFTGLERAVRTLFGDDHGCDRGLCRKYRTAVDFELCAPISCLAMQSLLAKARIKPQIQVEGHIYFRWEPCTQLRTDARSPCCERLAMWPMTDGFVHLNR
jgi:hypothetical protein